jgi:hypothetical protein
MVRVVLRSQERVLHRWLLLVLELLLPFESSPHRLVFSSWDDRIFCHQGSR